MATAKRPSNDESIFRIPPHYYLHVLDQMTNVTRLETGPKTFVRQDNERVILGPEKMVIIPPRHYCIIENPVLQDKDGKPVIDQFGEIKLRHAEREVRLEQEPFPLYYGELIYQKVMPLTVVGPNFALRLTALRDFTDEKGTKRIAGDERLFEGPGTYIPRIEEMVVEKVVSTTLRANQALRLRARMDTKDRDGHDRVTGEEWLVRRIGAYLPGTYEEVIEVVDAYVLTEKEAVHVKATKTFVDDLGVSRKNGEEWLVTLEETETFIPNVYETVIGTVEITTLSNRQYCVILDPVGEDGKPQLGRKKLVKGDKSFFLQPGERLEKGIQDVFVLGENEGLILRAIEELTDKSVAPIATRQPGDRWMIRGPTEYVAPVEVEVVTKRVAVPLDENEGIYVRDIKTGRVRAVVGNTYMLNQDEELWEKNLPPNAEELLVSGKDPLADRNDYMRGRQFSAPAQPPARDKTRLVTFRVPHNAAVQVYDYKEKKARVVFGPDLVMLGPDEQFTLLSLSGGKPKRPGAIMALCLLLGPDFFTDVIVVETSDHARLQLQLAYNWHFELGNKTDEESAKLFSIPDFVGDACKAIASRIRGAVAGVPFDDFHKNSSRIIRSSVFGLDEHQKVRQSFKFPQNSLVITSVDIQSVEPVDQRTRDSLQKSVQLAIEITTNSQEAAARHEAQRVEQQAKGRLERQRITDEAAAEKERKDLLELQAASAAVESCGQATAEARSRAEAARIEGEAAVQQAKLKADASTIEAESELQRLNKAREAELSYISKQNELEIFKSKEMATIEVQKFRDSVTVLGQDTIRAIATSNQDSQVKLLQSLGLQSTLITDGKTPINLFSTALGFLGKTKMAGVGYEESPAKMSKPQEYDD